MKSRIDRGTGIVILCAVAGAAAYGALVCLPQQRAIRQMAEELRTKRDYVARMGNLAPTIQATQQELEKAHAYNAAWLEQAPNAKQLATLHGQISALAKAAGTTTTRFDPEPIVACGQIRKIPLTVGCRGSYAQVHKFLSDLEGLPEAVWVNRIGLEVLPQEGENIQAELRLVVFTDNPDNSDQVDHSG